MKLFNRYIDVPRYNSMKKDSRGKHFNGRLGTGTMYNVNLEATVVSMYYAKRIVEMRTGNLTLRDNFCADWCEYACFETYAIRVFRLDR